MTPLRIPETRRPLVSIVMATYQSWKWAQKALVAVTDHTDEPYELILVDNASTDGTPDRLASEIEGARVVLNGKNHGFGAACNQGAALARAPFIVFLNSDAIVHRGWLRPLVDALTGEIGAAGPLLLNLDGSVQEAGGCVSRIGQTAAYGAGKPRDSRDVGFQRVVDYVSAACLAVRRSAFHEVGGFDHVYGRGYFEDVDLCFQLRTRGNLTLYTPRSVVTHVRGGSVDGNIDYRPLEENRLRFFRRWRTVLTDRPKEPLTDGPSGIALRDAAASDRILVVRGDASPRSHEARDLALELTETWPASRVTVLMAQAGNDDETKELLAGGVEVRSPERDLERWFFDRLFHYDVVVATGGDLPPATGDILRRTQPQAITVDANALGPESLVDVMADAGVAPPRRRVTKNADAGALEA